MRIKLILSLFPGIDLLGRGFELEEFCVVRGPDILWGGDIKNFHPPQNIFEGIIGGAPCQKFSKALMGHESTMPDLTDEFTRIIEETNPFWFLAENVLKAPLPNPPRYYFQDLSLNAVDFGVNQERRRRFRFGCLKELRIFPEFTLNFQARDILPTVTATEYKGSKNDKRRASRFYGRRLTLSEVCCAMGLPSDFNLPPFKLSEKYRAVGNGVPIPMAKAIARAIKNITIEEKQ